jgi:serine/threonine-protein kinase
MTHPSREQLRQLLAEELRPADRAWVEGHVNDCERCLERLELLQPPRPDDLHALADLLLHPPPGDTACRWEDGGAGEPPASPGAGSGLGAGPGAPAGWPRFAGYEILDRVGGGGMGEVYRARQVRTGRVVALKTVAPAPAGAAPDHAERLARFRAEAEAVSRLQHPNIVAIFDVGEQDGRPFFTMEWVSGGSLAERLAGRPVGEGQAAEWLAALAHAVHHAHRHGVVHRDLKPANVLLQRVQNDGGRGDGGDTAAPEGSSSLLPKITDFGVAKLLGRADSPTRPCQVLGTPEYMAPEQAAGGAGAHEVGPAADVYALGGLLYELLTGRPPFRGDEPLETLRQVRDEEPLSPRRLRPRLSRDLETICLKCLHKDPAGRYASARELADDLGRWRAGRAIRARPVGLGGRSLKWARRHPERAALVGLAAAFVLVAVAGFFWRLWAGCDGYARQLAGAVGHQLLLVKYAVGQTAQEEKLRRLLAGAPADRASLRAFLTDTRRDFLRWFTRPGEEPPIINWFIMDAEGTILADSYLDPVSVGKNYAFRDYYRGLLGPRAAADRAAVYVSQVYLSEQDDRCKFTVITRVWEGDRPLGLLGASIATGSRMVALDMGRELPGAAVVGPLDRTPRPGDPGVAGDRPGYAVVLRRDWPAPGAGPVAVAPARLGTLASLAPGAGPGQAAERFSADGRMVNYARVPDSPFVVIVEQPYPAPVGLLLRPPVPAVLAGAAALACLGTLARRRWARRPAAL